MSARPKLNPAAVKRFLAVMAARKALPSDKELARESNVSVSALYQAARKLHAIAVSRGTK